MKSDSPQLQPEVQNMSKGISVLPTSLPLSLNTFLITLSSQTLILSYLMIISLVSQWVIHCLLIMWQQPRRQRPKWLTAWKWEFKNLHGDFHTGLWAALWFCLKINHLLQGFLTQSIPFLSQTNPVFSLLWFNAMIFFLVKHSCSEHKFMLLFYNVHLRKPQRNLQKNK